MLLNNSDLDPLNKNKHPESIDWKNFVGMDKLIRFIPLISPGEQNTKSKIVLMFTDGTISNSNSDNENLELEIYIFCPFVEWQIAGDTLRPFAIMNKIRQSI